MKTLKQILTPNTMRYSINLFVRGRGIELLKLTEEEKNQLLKEDDLDSVYCDWRSEKNFDFEYEGQFLTYSVDRYRLEVEDEDGNMVYESENVMDLLNNDKTYLDEDQEINIEGYDFEGIDDGYYLVRSQTIKGCHYCCELELDGSFDESKLYVVRDRYINDELTGDDVFPFENICYQKGNTPNLYEDNLDLEFESDYGEQYFDTYLYEVSHKDYWKNLQDE